MIWHGSQVFLGIYFNLRRFYSENPPKIKEYFLRAVPIFLAFVTVALILNLSVYKYLMANAMEDTFNMFFISPYFECVFPVLDLIQAYTPYPVFLLSYVFFLSAFSFVLVYSELWVARKFKERADKKAAESTL